MTAHFHVQPALVVGAFMSEENEVFAARFARWQKAARERRGWTIARLAAAIPYSDSQVRIFDADARAGFDATGKYRRPKWDYVEAVAKVTGADLEEGLIASKWRLEPDNASMVKAKSLQSLILKLAPEDQDAIQYMAERLASGKGAL
jgi:hypothetical protein